MRVPLSWLEEFLPLEGFTPEEIARRLSLQSVEATVERFGVDIEGVVFGKVLKVERHPKEENLRILSVLVGEGSKVQVVTADGNVYEGDGVIVALPDAKVGSKRITKREFDGVASEGMLLSPQELGLEDTSEGVLRIEEDLEPGADARHVLGFGEWIVELDITPNRGDVLSVRGLARDLGAILGIERREVHTPAFEEKGHVEIEILDEDCWRYRGAIIEGVKIGLSPLAVRKRLWQCGFRSINNVVDITNYILLQEGQPLHAFDLDKIEGSIRVRSAESGEVITTLDGERRKLSGDILVIADGKGPVAIAGIIGGLDSSVTKDTKNVLLEAAYFAPKRIRKGSRKLGLQTESSYRFERNVDIERLSTAQDVALRMVTDVAGGKVSGVRDVYVRRYEPKKIFLSQGKYMRYAGETYKNDEVKRILTALDIPHEIKRCGIEASVPAHRSFDISRDVDIVEEIMRVKGYESFSSQRLNLPSEGKLWKDELLEIKKFLRDKGLEEVINISFEGPELYDKLGINRPSLEILNPLVPSQRFLRSSLVPSLLRVALFNESHYNYDIGIFEVGKVFKENGEEEVLAILLKGRVREFPEKSWDPYDLLEILQGLASIYRRELYFRKSELPFLHPHVQSEVLLEDKVIGFLGKLHPRLKEELELRKDVLLCQLTLKEIVGGVPPSYKRVSKFPPVIRDLALVVDKSLPVSKLLNEIKSQLGEKVEEVMVFDLYAGEKVGEGKKSVGVRVVLRSLEGSLSGEEVNSYVDGLVRRLRERLGVEIR